jgi:hypothetical protein
MGQFNGIDTMKLRTRKEDPTGRLVEVETVTEEYAITPVGGIDFSKPGDSGAFILDDHGRLVGLLFASATGDSNATSISRFIGVEELFEDIKQQTGAADVRVYGAFNGKGSLAYLSACSIAEDNFFFFFRFAKWWICSHPRGAFEIR